MRKIIILIITISSIFGSANAQKYGMFKPLGQIILFADTLKEKHTTDMQISKLKNDTSHIRNKFTNSYNLAICYMAKGNVDSVYIYLLRSMISNPFFNRLILSDSDFEPLHGSTRWKELTDKIDSVLLSTIPTVSKPKLAVELFHIKERDQYARGYGLKYPDKSTMNIDSLNLIRVEEIIKEYGWPTYSMVGKEAADGAFLVIQHSTTAIQKKYLNQLLDAAKNKQASSESVALLQDRIM
ncbi:MAG: hypothetical protein Q8904_00005, partial [Bacteroidota bacterium]|nr:hypothetical protein [Bacteroidota bacterium]